MDQSGISEQLRFVQAISEGPILGLVNGLRSVYLDKTPVQSVSGAFNIHGLNLALVAGTPNQAVIPGFPDVETPSAVEVQVTKGGGGIARTISTPNLSAVRVRMRYPAMQSVDAASGAVSAASVKIQITRQNGSYNGGVAEIVPLSDDGVCSIKTASAYTKAWRIEIPQGFSGAWTITVSRVTDDSSSSYLQDQSWWADYTELLDERFRYPYTATMAISVDAKSFNSVPELTTECYLKIINVPSNYDPFTRIYTGIWDGTFKEAWSDNPAWCWYDLATKTRYGAGLFIQTSGMDKWALYDIGQFCDKLVDDGKGGKEPRMTMNIYIQSQSEAIKVLSELASVFWGIAYYSAGMVTAVADQDEQPVALYTNANVVDGKFGYSGSAKKARHTSAIVNWTDPNLGYSQNQEIYEYKDARIRYGYNQLSVSAIACTSRGQARRLGQWMIFSEFFGTGVVNFSPGLDGSIVSPGDIIQVRDARRAGNLRLGGRVGPSSTTTSISLDAPVVLAAGKLYYLKIWQSDGTVETKAILTGAGTWQAITTAAFSVPPPETAVFIIQEEAEAELYRVISVSEEDDGQAHKITALRHDPRKFALIGVGNDFGNKVTDNPEFPMPVGLGSTVSVKSIGGSLVVRVTPFWSAPTGFQPSSYQLAYRFAGGPWTSVAVQGSSAEIIGPGLGLYEFKVYAIYQTSKSSPATWSTTAEITGNPPNVTGLAWVYRDSMAMLAWSAVNDVRGIDYEIRMGSTWANALVLGRVPESQLSFVTLADGTYWVAAYFMGLYSPNPASVVVTGSTLVQNVVQTWDEKATSWGGTFGGSCAADGGGNIWLTGAGLSGTYEIPSGHIVDIGTVQPCRVSVAYTAATTSLSNDWDSVPVFDAWADTDGNVPGMGSVSIEIATADGSGTFGAWQAFTPGTYLARKFKLRATLTRADTTVTQYLQSFSWTVDMPDRIVKGTAASAPSGGLAVTFSPAFQITPNVQITIVNATAGDDVFFPVAPSSTGFTVQIRNGGSNVARTINWSAIGY